MKNKTWLGCGLSCVLLALVPASCSPGGPSGGERPGQRSEPIFHGTPDTDDAACVVIQMPGGLCTGTIIAKNGATGYVLTAAHCFERQPPPSSLQVGQGTDPFDQNPGGGADAIYPVIDYAIHPSFDTAGDYDIALVRIGNAANAPVIPALQPSEDTLNVGTPVEFVGYGRTETDGLGLRLTVNGTIANSPFSAQPALGPLSFEYIQTPDIGGPCQGDSGGPAFVGTGAAKRVAGVTSYGDAECTKFGVSARVSGYYADFIAPRIGGTTTPPTCSQCIGTATAASTGTCRTQWARCEEGACAAPTDCCATFLDCYSACGANDSTCQQACITSFPTGVGQYDTYSSCICDQSCATPCSAECISDPGPDPTTCNGCTEIKGPTACSSQVAACQDSQACQDFSDCYSAVTSAAELSACEVQYATGATQLYAYFDCLCGTACPTECTAECVDRSGVGCGFSSLSEGGLCDACWQKTCCAEGKACTENSACLACALDEQCTSDPMFSQFLGCVDSNCHAECFGDDGTGGAGGAGGAGTNGASGTGGSGAESGSGGGGGTAGGGSGGSGPTIAPRQEDDDDGGGCSVKPRRSSGSTTPVLFLAALFALTAAGRRRKSARCA